MTAVSARFGERAREPLDDLTPGTERHAGLAAAVARAERKAAGSLPR
jgi:hypothetical protein